MYKAGSSCHKMQTLEEHHKEVILDFKVEYMVNLSPEEDSMVEILDMEGQLRLAIIWVVSSSIIRITRRDPMASTIIQLLCRFLANNLLRTGGKPKSSRQSLSKWSLTPRPDDVCEYDGDPINDIILCGRILRRIEEPMRT